MLRARLRCLVRQHSPNRWRVNGDAVAYAIKSSARRLPDKPHELAFIAHGVGEMAAWCNSDLLSPFLRACPQIAKKPRQIQEFLSRSLSMAKPIDERSSAVALALAKALKNGTLSWGSSRTACSCVAHPYDVSFGRNYGFAFACRLAIRLNPSAVGKWIDIIESSPPLLVTLIRSAVDDLWVNKVRATNCLLRTGNPFLISMAAAMIAAPHHDRPLKNTYKDAFDVIEGAGVDSGDAVWLAGLQLKEVVHERNRLEGRVDQNLHNLSVVNANPEKALGGASNAPGEISRLEAEQESLAVAWADCIATLEGILFDMGECWPAKGLDNSQHVNLENLFVDTAEIRYRLAMSVPHQMDRRALLKKNIDLVSGVIGFKTENFDEYYSLQHDPDRILDLIEWSAKSFAALYEGDSKGVGHRAGQVVGPLAGRALRLLRQPFIHARQTTAYQAAAARSNAADMFALAVIEATPKSDQAGVQMLREHATKHAYDVLCCTRGRLSERDLSYRLANNAIPHLDQDVRLIWAQTEELPLLIRARAIWSDPSLVKIQEVLATDLFLRAAAPPISPRAEAQHFSELVSILDAVMTKAIAESAPHILNELVKLWSIVIDDWPAYRTSRWADSAGLIARALTSDGPDRTFILTDYSFANSNTKLWLTGAGECV